MNIAYLLAFLALLCLVMMSWGVRTGHRPSVVAYMMISLTLMCAGFAVYPIHAEYLARKQLAIDTAQLELELQRIEGVSAAFGSPAAAAEYLKTH